MDPERVQDLFERARSARGGERDALLRAETSPGIRAEVEELLRFAERDSHPIDGFRVDEEMLERALEAPLDPWPDPPPEHIGPYRIQGMLGAGSMSTVFLAEGTSGRGDVAVKVLRPWLLSPRALRRFEAEVELLSRFDHPFIARLLDAGEAEIGGGSHPYLVLERVDGVPLDEWVAARAPSLEERLRLFRAICDAVAHAHRHGVIHRDLKPSNVLVTAAGEPRVLDFGVARTVGDERRTASLLTSVGQVIGTLEYMSPEQAGGRPDDVDTRSDVYALGVLLYEMLAGRRPIDFADSSTPEALRRIAEEEPVALGALDRRFLGDLETIARTALAKERERRYATVQELAGDVERYLADRPILARPPSSAYLARKYFLRHPAKATGVVIGFLAVVATTVGIVLGWADAREQRRLAEERLYEQEAAREESDRVATILAGMIRAPEASQYGRDVLLRDVVRDLGEEIQRHLPDQPRGRAHLSLFLAQSLANLDDPSRALKHVERSLEDFRVAALEDEPLAFDARMLRGDLLGVLGRLDEAVGVQWNNLDRLLRARPADRDRIARSRMALGKALGNVGRIEDARREFEASYSALAELYGERSAAALDARVRLAGIDLARGRHQDVVDEMATLLPTLREVHAAEPHLLGAPISLYSQALTVTGDLEYAATLGAEQVAISERAYGPEHYFTWQARADLMSTWVSLGRQDRVREIAEQLLAWSQEHLVWQHPLTIEALSRLGMCELVDGRVHEAAVHYGEALARGEVQFENAPEKLAELRMSLGGVALYDGRGEEALAAFRTAAEALDAANPAHATALDRARLGLAKSLLATGALELGLAELRAHLEAFAEANGRSNPYTVYLALDGAVALLNAGLVQEADDTLAPFDAELAARFEDSVVQRELWVAVILQRGIIALKRSDAASVRIRLRLAEKVADRLPRPLATDVASAFALLRDWLAEEAAGPR